MGGYLHYNQEVVRETVKAPTSTARLSQLPLYRKGGLWVKCNAIIPRKNRPDRRPPSVTARDRIADMCHCRGDGILI